MSNCSKNKLYSSNNRNLFIMLWFTNITMPPEFKENVILHIEDADNWTRAVKRQIQYSQEIQTAYGGKIAHVSSEIGQELPQGELEAEIARIGGEMGDGPALVSVVTAQVARTFLSQYLPGVVVSDTSFPLNGKRVVEWICEHGFNDYALIGLSGTDFDTLDPVLQKWFGKSRLTTKRYGLPMS